MSFCVPASAWRHQFESSSRFCLLCLLLLWPCLTVAQQGNGALRGSVQDADFFVPLGGARVVVEGGGQSAVTDENGAFFLNDIPPGEHTLLITKDGYISERRAGLVVNASSVKEVDLRMTGQVVELDEFIVSAEEITETSSAQALQLRTELKSFTDVLGAQFIAQTGASDAAKLVAKTTGVNVADGKFVVVRGLNDRYNVVTLNGVRVPSSDPDRRAVALDLFPTAVIRDVRTSKTFQPDLNAESTGGTIDIYTKAVPDENFTKFKIGTGYNSQATGNSKYLTYNGGGTGMFGTAESRALPDFIRNDPLPFLTTTALSGLPPGNTRIDNPIRMARQATNDALSPVMGTSEEPAPMDLSLEASMGHRTEFLGAPAGITVAFDYSKKYTYNVDKLGRYTFTPGSGTVFDINRVSDVRNGQETMRAGLLVAAGIQPDARNEVVATYFFNRVAEDRATLQYGQLGQNFTDTQLDYRESLAYTQRDLKVMQLAGRHDRDFDGRDLEVRWALSYNQSSQLEPDHRFVRGIYEDSPPNAAGTVGTYQPVPGNPTVPEFQRLWRELYDQSYSFRLDVITDLFEQDDIEAKVKFGTAFDYTDRNYRADGFAYNRGAQNNQFPSAAKPGFPGATWADVFLYGNLPVGQDLDGIPNNSANNNATGRLWIYRPNAFEFYDASQMLASSYAALDFELAPGLDVTFGVRLESTDVKVQSSPIYQYPEETLRFALLSAADRENDTMQQLVNAAFNGDVDAQQDPRIVARSRASIQEHHLLPALSVNWDISDKARLRTAIARTIARPSFKEIAPVVFQNVESGDFFAGNSDLELSNIMNYDVRWEWFPTPGSLLGVSFFAKSIRNPIELEQSAAASGPTLTRFINSPDAVVYGLELEFQRDLSFIGDELRWFSLGANYSYISSVARRAPFVDNLGNTVPSLFGETRRLQGQPDYIANFNLTYDNPEQPFGAAVFLNIVGPQLFAVGGQPEDPDILQEPVTTLDLSLSYRLSKRAKVTFRAQNLLNAAVRRFYDNAERPLHSERKTGIGYSVSMTLDW
jgi:TonB-dependent receptor